MPTLTKDNAREHCRTCLNKLSEKDASPSNKTEESPEEGGPNDPNESKEFAIDISANEELRRLILKYIDSECSARCGRGADEKEDEWPQHLCLACYNRLHGFERFRRRAVDSAAKLRSLLGGGAGVAKVEIDEYPAEEEEEGLHGEAPNSNEEICKLFLKDSLMETESVMLDSSAVATLASVEMHDPDPFDAVPPAKVLQDGETDDVKATATVDYDWHRNFCQESDESSASSEEDENQGEKSSGRRKERAAESDDDDSGTNDEEGEEEAEEDVAKQDETNRSLRLRRRKSTTAPSGEKKKRRGKKEIATQRQTQATERGGKIKRRNKGSKNSFKCTQCNHCFAHKITLDAHIRKVHEGNKRPFQCDRCDKAYTFIGGLYTHIKEIHESDVRSYTCDFEGCERIYTSFIAMQKHKRLKHLEIGSQKTYVCEQCGATFHQTGNLKYHRRTKHPTEADLAERERSKERYECNVCNKLFHSRYTLKYHTLQLHSNDMKYECSVCGRRMAKKFMLVQHMLVHSTDKMPCEHCGKQFIRKFELEAHIRAVHMKLKPFECQYCQECFASRKTLRHHEYIHTGEKPYVCDICGQAYRQQTCLKNHRKSHEKLNAEALLAANLNRSLMHGFLGPPNAHPPPLPPLPHQPPLQTGAGSCLN